MAQIAADEEGVSVSPVLLLFNSSVQPAASGDAAYRANGTRDPGIPKECERLDRGCARNERHPW